MGVYINRMEMPTNCDKCIYSSWSNFFHIYVCDAIRKTEPVLFDGKQTKSIAVVRSARADNCPLVPVPPHGRLIDADALITDLKRQCKEVFRIDAVSPDDFWITRNEAYNERLWTSWCESLYDYINAALTIIPPEEDPK